MKLQFHRIAFALLTAIAATAPGMTHAAGDDHTPRHGGVMVAGKAADFELVATPTLLQLYVSDHGKPRDVSKAGAKLTLLSGANKQDVQLTPAGDKLQAAGSFQVGAGTKVVAVVSDAGKTLGTARFTLK